MRDCELGDVESGSRVGMPLKWITLRLKPPISSDHSRAILRTALNLQLKSIVHADTNCSRIRRQNAPDISLQLNKVYIQHICSDAGLQYPPEYDVAKLRAWIAVFSPKNEPLHWIDMTPNPYKTDGIPKWCFRTLGLSGNPR